MRSSVSLLCLFYTMLLKLAYCYLCAISLISVLDLCSLVSFSRSATCFMLSLCYFSNIYAHILHRLKLSSLSVARVALTASGSYGGNA